MRLLLTKQNLVIEAAETLMLSRLPYEAVLCEYEVSLEKVQPLLV